MFDSSSLNFATAIIENMVCIFRSLLKVWNSDKYDIYKTGLISLTLCKTCWNYSCHLIFMFNRIIALLITLNFCHIYAWYFCRLIYIWCIQKCYSKRMPQRQIFFTQARSAYTYKLLIHRLSGFRNRKCMNNIVQNMLVQEDILFVGIIYQYRNILKYSKKYLMHQ